MPHCFITQDSAVINLPDVKHVWRCISFYVWHCLMKDVVLCFLCMHITFAFGSQKIGWRALAASDWRWMSLSLRTCRMNGSLFWAHGSVLIQSLSFFIFIPLVVIFHFSPLSALPASSPCFQWSHLIAIWSVLFCHYHHVLSVCSHIFQELINWRFLQSCWNIFFYTVAADAGIHF